MLSLLIATATVSAQNFYNVSPNARATALGGATLAIQGDAYPTFGNPASPLLQFQYKSIQAAFAYTTFSESAMSNYRLMAFGGYGRVAIQHAISVGGQFAIEPHDATTGKRSGMQRFDLGYGYQLGDNIALAATARYRRSYGHGTESGVANFDSGGLDIALFSRLPIAIKEGAMLNLGAKLTYESAASLGYDAYTFAPSVGAGIWLPFGDGHTLESAAELQYGLCGSNNVVCAKLGVEYGLMQLLYFRCGGNLYHLHNATTIGYGSVGLGVRFFHLQFDVAYSVGRRGTPMHNAVQFSAGLDF